MKSEKKYNVVHLFGIILSILFEFLGVLLFFGITGYYIQVYFFEHNFLVLVLFLFFGMIVGIYFMYKRSKRLRNIEIEDKEFRVKNFLTDRDKETQERIKKVQSELKEFGKFLDEKLKDKNK